MRFMYGRIKKYVAKGENAGYQLFQKASCFQEASI